MRNIFGLRNPTTFNGRDLAHTTSNTPGQVNNPTLQRGAIVNTDAASPAKFNAITPEQHQQIMALAVRASAMIQNYKLGDKTIGFEENPALIRIDFAVVLLLRRYDLTAALRSDDLTFWQDFCNIQKNIQRPNVFFPQEVRLHFARTGERVQP